MKDSAKESPAKPHLDDDPVLAARQSRLGLVLFFVYLAAYGGFMGLSAFAPSLMARPVFAGVNLAIAYGLGLIFGAVVLAMLYMFLSSLVLRRFQEEQQ
jgi:uncharacterized membrane protein (DUF485 family)